MMIRIKDVAKHARVSVGTISNFLKGDVYISPEKVRRIKKAIKELGYKPSITASRLKSKIVKNISIIIPNIRDLGYSMIYEGVEKILSENNYNLSVFTTNDEISKEEFAINQAIQSKSQGIIIITCQPQNSDLFDDIEKSGPKLICLERKIKGEKFNSIQHNNFKSVHKIIKDNLNNGKLKILLITGPKIYSNEEQCISAYKKAYKDIGFDYDDSCIKNIPINKEDAFIETIDFLNENPIDSIISTSTELLDGIISATNLLGKKPKLTCLSEYSWSDNRYPDIVKVQRNSIQLGDTAARKMIEIIENPKREDHFSINIENIKLDEGKKEKKLNSKKSLRILMIEGFAPRAIIKVLTDFKTRYSIDVDIDTLKYDDLYQEILKKSNNKYDVFCSDIEWLVELVKCNKISRLDNFIKTDVSILEEFDTKIINHYSRMDKGYYALPFILDAQNLFYRKDLFEDIEIKSLFYKKYKKKLEVPNNWDDFDCIANFFTKKFNPDSPVEYGIVLSSNSLLTAICGYLPRLWSKYNSRLFIDEKNPLINREKAESCLNEYKEIFKLSSDKSFTNSFEDQAEEFNSGDAAMTINWCYGQFSNLANLHKEMMGNIGCDTIPGKKSILGGWSLAINNNSKFKKQAFDFIRWVVKDVSIPIVLLEGASANINLKKNLELKNRFPFIPKMFESLDNSERLNINSLTTNGKITQKQYRTILGEMILNVVNKNLPPGKEIVKANKKIGILLEN